MSLQEIYDFLKSNGGSLLGLLTIAIVSFVGLWQVLPPLFKSNSVQIDLLTKLSAERDAAVRQLEVVRDKYDALLREWSGLNASLAAVNAQVAALKQALEEANATIAKLDGNVRKASRFIDSLPDDEGSSNV